MSNHPIVWIFAAMILAVGAAHQIATGIYYLGCFRNYNRFVDKMTYWFENVSGEEAAEAIQNLVLILAAVVVIVAVVI